MNSTSECDFKVPGYVMLNKLGEGQFGKVFKARNLTTNKEFAIKGCLVDKINSIPKLRELFETEVAIMRKIKHPNILHCYEKLEDNKYYYLVLDYCNSGDLEQYLQNKCPQRRMIESEAVYFLKQLMNGFAELHSRKIMHRDFKPANVFLHNDNVVIGDFGFAKSGAELTTTNVGTPLFKAPELHKSQTSGKNYTNKVDIFALSMTFYNMLYGDMPWKPTNLYHLQQLAENETGKKLPFKPHIQISEIAKDFMIKASEPNPDLRPSLDDLFRHAIFNEYSEGQAVEPQRSVMFFGNRIMADRIFEQNKQKQPEVHKFVDVLSLDKHELDKFLSYPPYQSAKVENSRQEHLNYQPILERIYHEKQVTYFMFCCSQELLGLVESMPAGAKLIADINAIVALLIAKKSTCINQTTVGHIFERSNVYKLACFDKFVDSVACEKILEELLQDNVVLGELLDNLMTTVNKQIEYSADESARSLDLVRSENPTIPSLNSALANNLGTLNMFKESLTGVISSDKKNSLERVLAKATISMESDKYMPYQTKSTGTFNWNAFEELFRGNTNSTSLILATANNLIV